MGRVSNKVALITGAARGQGRSHAVRLAEEGADILAIDLCEQIESAPYGLATRADLDQTAKEVEALGRRVVIEQADVRDLRQVQAAVERGVAALGPLDIVVANAGILSCGSIQEMPATTWQDMIDVNLTGVWNTVKATAPAMERRGAGGSIVLISSAAGIKGFPMVAHYTAAKHGVVGLMKALAGELGPARIRVNTVNPTAVFTPMLEHDTVFRLFRPDLDNPGLQDLADVILGRHMLPEPWVSARDVSDAVLFLAADESRFITGQQLKVDLGYCEK